MKKESYEVMKESYFLKSTFFYNKLRMNGYFELFMKVQNMSQIEGKSLNWKQRDKWNIGASAWETLASKNIDPMLVFVHPKILQLNPMFLKYYRSVAMISQKGLKALTGISSVEKIESGKIESGRLPLEMVRRIVDVINEILSLVVMLATDIDANEIQGMMYATAGTNIDGSWRNAIGTEGERVIRSILLKELLVNDEVSSVTDKRNRTTDVKIMQMNKVMEKLDSIRTVNLINGYSILFSSEPDVSMFNDEGDIAGVIEIKAGLDPAGALERLGAMFKSFENTLAEYPDAVTVLIASCITDEVEARLGAAMSVRQKYVTTDITASENRRRKFANRMRRILRLAK